MWLYEPIQPHVWDHILMKSDVRATINNKVERERDEARAQVTELTRERDSLDANRHRLIEIINSNLDERDKLISAVTALTNQLAAVNKAWDDCETQLMNERNQVRLLQAHPSERYWEERWRDADTQVTALTAENAVMREAALEAVGELTSREKEVGYKSDTVDDLARALSTPNPKARRMVEELERHRAFFAQQSDAFDDFHNTEVALHNAALTADEIS